MARQNPAGLGLGLLIAGGLALAYLATRPAEKEAGGYTLEYQKTHPLALSSMIERIIKTQIADWSAAQRTEANAQPHTAQVKGIVAVEPATMQTLITPDGTALPIEPWDWIVFAKLIPAGLKEGDPGTTDAYFVSRSGMAGRADPQGLGNLIYLGPKIIRA